MMTDVVVPADMWDGAGEAAISAWLYANGDPVKAGAVIAEIMIEKSSVELLAPASGTLTIVTPAEAEVERGQVIARIAA